MNVEKRNFIKAISEGNVNEAKTIKQQIETNICKPTITEIILQNSDGSFEYERVFVDSDKWHKGNLVSQRLSEYSKQKLTGELWAKILEGCTSIF